MSQIPFWNSEPSTRTISCGPWCSCSDSSLALQARNIWNRENQRPNQTVNFSGVIHSFIPEEKTPGIFIILVKAILDAGKDSRSLLWSWNGWRCWKSPVSNKPNSFNSHFLWFPGHFFSLNPHDKCIILCKRSIYSRGEQRGLALEWRNHTEILSVYFMCSEVGNVQVLLPGSFPRCAVLVGQRGSGNVPAWRIPWEDLDGIWSSVSWDKDRHTSNLRGSGVLRPPWDEPVQDYLAPHGSDPYSSHIASCTGTEGKVSKIISIQKKNNLSANLLLRSNQSNISMEHQREIRNARRKTKTKKFRNYIGG